MKKALNINLGGIIFHIDEDAYEHLNQYIAGLERKFGNAPESKEIISDIEARMAELLQERITRSKQSVDLSDVEYVIAVMGGPEEVAQESTYTSNQDSPRRPWYQRRLYRDPDNSIIGGVCSGLAAFFGIDPVILRILFLVLLFFGGSSVLLYLILWIALPAARTPVQKLEMKGEDVNISSIEKASRSSAQNMPKNGWQTFFESFAQILGGILKAAVKVLAVFIGFMLILVGAAIMMFFIVLNAGIFEGFHPMDFNLGLPMLFHFAIAQGNWGFQIANFLVFILPILAIVYLGIKLLFGLKYNDKTIWFSALVLWLLGIVLWIILAFSTVRSVKSEGIVQENRQFTTQPNRVLVLDVKDPWPDDQNNKFQLKTNDKSLYFLSNKNEIIGKAEIIIEKGNKNQVDITLEKSARGKNEQEAESKTQSIKVSVSQNDSIIYLPAYFVLTNRKDWRIQHLRVIVRIPEGQIVYISPQLKDILIDAELNESRWISELPGNTWKMTNNGLQMINRQP